MPREDNFELPSTYYDYHVSGLAEIYRESINMCIWQRQLPVLLINYVEKLIENKHWSMRTVVDVKSIYDEIYSALPTLNDEGGRLALTEDVTAIATLFADLFELTSVGVRFSILDRTMCPRFHTDNLPCRLVTTYMGKGTEWLPEYAVDRSKLGHVSSGLADRDSGVYLKKDDIQTLAEGEVALMKGSGWDGCKTALVHRSPEINSDDKRLILTLDFAH